MNPGLNDLENRVAENVGRLMSSGLAGTSSPASSASFAHLERHLVVRHRRVRGMQVLCAIGAVLVIAGVGYRAQVPWRHGGDEILTFQVESSPSLDHGGPIEGGSDARGREVTFSDGTQVHMDPHARGRVMNLDRLGARVELERGRAHVDVRHRPAARWSFQAGPFEVHVTGTAFSLGWDPETAHFDLRMESGVVSVAGPLSGGEMVLRAGETLSVGLRDAEARPATTKLNDESPSDGAEPPAPPPTTFDDVPVSLASRRHVSVAMAGSGNRVRPGKDWREELANGRADAVVADASRRGLRRVLQSVSSEDLAALADAARYVGSHDLAQRALLTQRARFAGSARAAQASFLLGRLEDEGMGNSARALDWYDRYLAEAPTGVYAAEALGRKMMALEGAHRRDQAIAIASDYLRRFPAGSYAHAARVLVRPATPSAEVPPSASP